MKLNNKGFAISIVLYSMIILIIGIMYLLLDIVNDRYKMSKEAKEHVVEYINMQGVNTLSDELYNKIGVNKIINTNELVLKNGNYYYNGNDPDNYIQLSGELWRIIGIISVNDVKYLKIVKNEPITEMNCDNYQIVKSNVFTYLNNDYYKTLGNEKNMIQKINWYNTEHSTNITPYNAFKEESRDSAYNNNYIGLINASDFGYTASENYLTNNLSNYSASINDNWLALTNDYFTMSFYNKKINVVSNGNLVNSGENSFFVYPCIYLKKDVLITSGIGKEDNPYILSQ